MLTLTSKTFNSRRKLKAPSQEMPAAQTRVVRHSGGGAVFSNLAARASYERKPVVGCGADRSPHISKLYHGRHGNYKEMRGSKTWTQQCGAPNRDPRRAAVDAGARLDARANTTLLATAQLKEGTRRDAGGSEIRHGWVHAPTVQIGEGLLPAKETSYQSVHDVLAQQT